MTAESPSHMTEGLKGRHNNRCVGPPGLNRLYFQRIRWLTPPARAMSYLRYFGSQLVCCVVQENLQNAQARDVLQLPTLPSLTRRA